MSDTEHATRLKEFRAYLKRSQTDFAAAIGMKQRTYASYETGGNKIPFALLVALVDEYKLNVNWLISGFGPMQVDPRSGEMIQGPVYELNKEEQRKAHNVEMLQQKVKMYEEQIRIMEQSMGNMQTLIDLLQSQKEKV